MIPGDDAKPSPPSPEDKAAELRKLMDLMAYISPEELEEFKSRREEWKKDPISFLAWTIDQSYIHIQILNKVTMNPPPGKGSGGLSLQAIRDVREQAFMLIEQIREVGGLDGVGGKSQPKVDLDNETDVAKLPGKPKTRRGRRQ